LRAYIYSKSPWIITLDNKHDLLNLLKQAQSGVDVDTKACIMAGVISSINKIANLTSPTCSRTPTPEIPASAPNYSPPAAAQSDMLQSSHPS
jgi:hypothetical protein